MIRMKRTHVFYQMIVICRVVAEEHNIGGVRSQRLQTFCNGTASRGDPHPGLAPQGAAQGWD
jgi:hypothetical protein